MYSLILLMAHSLLTSLSPTGVLVKKSGLPLPTVSCVADIEKLFQLPSLTLTPRTLSRNILPDDDPAVLRMYQAALRLEQARDASFFGDWNRAIEEGIISWNLSRQDPDTALFVADQLRQVGRFSEALFYYRHAMFHELHPNFVGNAMPWDNREAIMRYADACLQAGQGKEADAAYWKVISMLKLTPVHSFEVCGITTMAERVAYIYFVFGLESKNLHYATSEFLPAIAYFQEALRRASAPIMRRASASQIESLIGSMQSAENGKIEAEKRAILEAQQKAAFEAQQKGSNPE